MKTETWVNQEKTDILLLNNWNRTSCWRIDTKLSWMATEYYHF